jgi:hypothetical protein
MTITLEITVEDEELRGQALDDGGVVHPFAGWIGLITAIDALVEGGPDPALLLSRRPLP